MVTIYMQGQDKTKQITDWRIKYDDPKKTLKLIVKFPSGKCFCSPMSECTVKPRKDYTGKLLLCEKNHCSEIERATEYGNKFIVVKYPRSEKLYVMKSADVYVTSKSNWRNEDLFKYFTKIAAERSTNAEDSTKKAIADNIQRQLKKITSFEGNALYAYCHKKNEKRESDDQLIFPFGINENQLKAVTNAFSSQISVIEGPPGTGKTQTILNIVANILLKNQKVAIVSNNNPAVSNVYEKLEKEKLGYLVAELGSIKNRNEFFASIKDIPPASNHAAIEMDSIQNTFGKLKDYLHAKNKLAQLTAEIKEFEIEKGYLEDWHSEHPTIQLIDVKKYKLSPKKITDLMAYIRHLTDKHISLTERFRLILSFRIFRTAFLNNYAERLNFVYTLQFSYYTKQIENRQKKIQQLEKTLKDINFNDTLDTLKKDSMLFLKQHLAKSIKDTKKPFKLGDYRCKGNFKQFIDRFPVIGSSTHSIINSLADGYILDYLIIDEASQQDIVPGILSLGCTKNIIIVGDRKQLPHIPDKSTLKCPSEYYDCSKYSLLDSITRVYENRIPVTLLKSSGNKSSEKS
ncbi:AAA family ATPase [Enterococcus sp. 669A]|uniref:AAA family ATPase n=1 Tax=Candidatus Enterococcus moelleringii TaxID=2815325 RepID=A0ABS3LFD3_9ENTE|nr:AAA domain-containing protein [Enterococcus sp. 669A]MBO1307084.1 AAA family ATPase [Enterococcus sp. 669A]